MADLIEGATRTAVTDVPASAASNRASGGAAEPHRQPDPAPQAPDLDLLHEHGVLTDAEFAAEKRRMRARRRRFLLAGQPAGGLASGR
jgi:hypothetical protein